MLQLEESVPSAITARGTCELFFLITCSTHMQKLFEFLSIYFMAMEQCLEIYPGNLMTVIAVTGFAIQHTLIIK